jgi:DNA-binding NtrC family response regulator
VTEQILLVGDDRRSLDDCAQVLRGEFAVEIVLSAKQALGAIHLFGPYAVVISEMRMSGMSGAELLAQIRQLAPNTVRMLLTGYKDLNRAIDAANEGLVYRYLAKPSGSRVLIHTVKLGLARYRMLAKRNDLTKESRPDHRAQHSASDPRPCA